jgi:cytochrome c oxidase subunit 2
VIGNFGWGLPESASTYAGEIDLGIRLIHWAMLGIFAAWGAYLAYLLVRYRHREGVGADTKPRREWQALAAGAVVLVVETAMILFYDIPVWAKIRSELPAVASSNVVQVTAEQFVWNFQYPGADGRFGRKDPKYIDSSNVIGLDPEDPAGKENVLTINELHVPLGKPTILYLTSKDVIHDFFVPSFRMKTDVVPGMQVALWFEPTKLGQFEIGCAQLCGIGHSKMRADVIVQTPDEYKSWLAAQLQAKRASQ